MATQKFNKGDHVRVAKNLGSSMSHFQNDCEAIVIGSYNDQYGGGNVKSYTIHIKDSGQVSWYEEHQLTLIEANRADLLDEWESKQEAERKEKSDLDWIFSHGKEVMERPHGASVQSLANCFGLDNLWGRNGEGITYYENTMGTLALAKPFLLAGDKNGWIAKAEKLKFELAK